MVGCNHNTADVAVREMLSFSPQQVFTTLQHWQTLYSGYEAVLLSTCNRTELYIASANGDIPDEEEILRFLLREKASSETAVEQLTGKLMILEEEKAVEHLFAVTGSLDSMVLGESQILAQVKTAYRQADEIGVTGPVTHTMFQAALNTAKRIDVETGIHKHRISIPSIAVVDFGLQIFERLEDKKTLIFGAGEMAEETLRYLVDYGARSIIILNRKRSRAEELAVKWSGLVEDWENRLRKLIDADIVITATGATEPIVTLSDFKTVHPQRKGRSLFILDLAIPRDFEPGIGDLPNVYLYSIDDLKKVCEKNRIARDAELTEAYKIVTQRTEQFFRDLRHQEAGTVIRKLRNDWELTKETELQRLLGKLPRLDDREKEEVCYAFDRLVNKLLHPPLESLRNESRHGVPQLLIDALARLFRR
jgi:glutamyl-tRNA reductase